MTSTMQAPFIRVVLADDSAVIRRLLTEAMAPYLEIEVVAAAHHGVEAVEALTACHPDVVLLDAEMPVMDGVKTVVEIRKLNPHIPIVMLSPITSSGRQATVEAIAAGANDHVAKPSQLGHVSGALKHIRDEVIPKIKSWGRRYQDRGTAPASPAPMRGDNVGQVSNLSARGLDRSKTCPTPTIDPASSVQPNASGQIEIVAIGASTGGPNALAELFAKLPADFPVPIVVTQHMPPVFTQLLADRLDRVSPLHVREGIEGAVLQPGEVWIAPGNFHMTVQNHKTDRVLRLDQNAQENSCRPAVDTLFRSVATVYGSRCLGVILTGMGKDGLNGSGEIRQRGGRIFIQDEASCVVWGMPRAVAEAGHADRVLPLSQIAEGITEAARYGKRSKTQVLIAQGSNE